ncbi:uncharacterized protein [Arachis hypogaea]|uniref:uncharacterized protein n=1 Tax=Arachis hypogaea TaxID=3818 RepID=UPI003B20B789
MLRACVLDQPASRDWYMPLVEFAYNIATMRALEWLRMKLYMAGNVNPHYVGMKLKKEIKKIRIRMLVAQRRQKSYADQRQKPLEFEEGEQVFLKFTLTAGVEKTIKTKKLNPRYIGPFEILKRIGSAAYKIALPPYLSNLHDMFHVSQF